MEVKIVTCSSDLYWYEQWIGKYFEVEKCDHGGFDLKIVKGEKKGYYLKSTDVMNTD